MSDIAPEDLAPDDSTSNDVGSGDSADADLGLSDVSQDETEDQDVASRSGESLLDHDDIGTLGDGQVDSAVTDRSKDAPTSGESEL